MRRRSGKRLRTGFAGDEAVKRLRHANPAILVGRINRARSMNVPCLSDVQIANRIGRLMDGFATKPIGVRTNAVFRARKNEGGGSFQNVSELWYPPAGLPQLGRFNLPGESVFYCASSIHSALWEIGVQPGDTATFLVCASKLAQVDITCAHIGMHLYIGKTQPSDVPFPDLRSDISFQRNLEAELLDRKWRRLDDYFSEIATSTASESPDLYRVTSRIGEILCRMGPVGGLCYPSVATGRRALNLRLANQCADETFFAAEAWECEIVHHVDALPGAEPSSTGFLQIRFIRRSEVIHDDGTIVWGSDNFEALEHLQTIFDRIDAARKVRKTC